MEQSLRDFVAEYVEPAAKELFRKIAAEEELSDLEKLVLASLGVPKKYIQ